MTLRRRMKTVQVFLRQRQEVLNFAAIPDPRGARGQRWSAPALLSTAVLGLMLLARSLRSAERLSEQLAEGQKRRGIDRRVPDSTLGEFLSRVEPEPIRQHLHRQILNEHRRKSLMPTVLPIGVVAIDGKNNATLDEQAHVDCQEQTEKGKAPRWVYRMVNATLTSSSAAVCIDRQGIPADTNDMGVFASFFAGLMATYGRANLFELVTTDAGFTSEHNAGLVDSAGKAYLMALKGNQPDLQTEARRVFSQITCNQEPEAETSWELDSSRGYIKRQLWRTDEMKAWGTWGHLRQVLLLRVLRRAGADGFQGPDQILEERLYVTNLPRGRLSAPVLIRVIRAHWRIENDFHGSLDIQWQEDHGRWVHRKNGLPVMGLLRAIAYNIMVLLRHAHLRTDAARTAAWDQLRDWVKNALVFEHFFDSDDEVLDTVTL